MEKISTAVNTLGVRSEARAIDGLEGSGFDSCMETCENRWLEGNPRVVGSFGNLEELRQSDAGEVAAACDVVELRLDLLKRDGWVGGERPWLHLADVPLLFTVRRKDEGGALALDAGERAAVLEGVLADAACVDIEVASILETEGLVRRLGDLGIPWVASFHDFSKLPGHDVLKDAASRARDAGAAVFKVAAMLNEPSDLARLADFQVEDQGIYKATMGMGPMATVARLLCAQCGSVLNYGYLGSCPTAPGQWHGSMLKRAISLLPRLRE